jgi:von Willebrand factor type A domain
MGIPGGQIPEPQRLRPKGIADVVICIDCTGSMSPCIEGVKNHVQKLVEGFQANESIKLDWRVRLVEYRDLNEGEATKQYPFTTDIGTFRTQVQNLVASGGGDEPESTLDAIFTALHSDWRKQSNKCIIVFTDATCHPDMHPSTVQPGQPSDVDEVINKLYETRARLFLFAPKFEIYDALAGADRMEYEVVSNSAGLGDVDFAKLMNAIGKTISASTEPVVET